MSWKPRKQLLNQSFPPKKTSMSWEPGFNKRSRTIRTLQDSSPMDPMQRAPTKNSNSTKTEFLWTQIKRAFKISSRWSKLRQIKETTLKSSESCLKCLNMTNRATFTKGICFWFVKGILIMMQVIWHRFRGQRRCKRFWIKLRLESLALVRLRWSHLENS